MAVYSDINIHDTEMGTPGRIGVGSPSDATSFPAVCLYSLLFSSPGGPGPAGVERGLRGFWRLGQMVAVDRVMTDRQSLLFMVSLGSPALRRAPLTSQDRFCPCRRKQEEEKVEWTAKLELAVGFSAFLFCSL